MKNILTIITICLLTIACSKDDVSKFNLTLDSTAGGNLNISSGTYDENAAVTLIAYPDEGYKFIGWSGSTDENTNPLIVSITNDKSIKANFEEQIKEVVGANGDFSGVGKWEIRSLSKSNASNRSAVCDLSEIIFRTNGSFTIVTSTTTTTGRFSVDSNTTINLKQEQNLFGTIKNLALTNGFISFSIELNNGCTENAKGDKDKTYDESKDPILIDCSIGGQPIGRVESQTVAINNAISDITLSFSSDCTLQADAINLPAGVTMSFNANNEAILTGTPSEEGVYNYTASVYSSSSSYTLGGMITVVKDLDLTFLGIYNEIMWQRTDENYQDYYVGFSNKIDSVLVYSVNIDPDYGYCFKYKLGKNKIPGSECGYKEGETTETYTIITHTKTRLILDVNTYDDSCETPFSIYYRYSYDIDGDFLYETKEYNGLEISEFNKYSQSTYSLDNYCNKF